MAKGNVANVGVYEIPTVVANVAHLVTRFAAVAAAAVGPEPNHKVDRKLRTIKTSGGPGAAAESELN
jgi:hypothetical protein